MSTNPHLLTRGVTAPNDIPSDETRGGIDWLQYSIPWPDGLPCWPKEPQRVEAALRSALPPPDEFAMTGEILNPMPGYSSGMGANYARLFWHKDIRAQHIGVIMSGDDLRAQIAIPYPQIDLLKWVLHTAKKIARLDLAIDVFDPRADPADILASWKAGEMVTPARDVQDITKWSRDANDQRIHATTIYVGARSSERQLRVYDKAKQMGLSGHWTRIELQLRDRWALSMARMCVGIGIKRTAQAAIRDFCKIQKLGWWYDALRAPMVEWPGVPREDHNTFDWLMKSCLPSIKKVLATGSERQRETLSKALKMALSAENADVVENYEHP